MDNIPEMPSEDELAIITKPRAIKRQAPAANNGASGSKRAALAINARPKRKRRASKNISYISRFIFF